MGYAKNNSRKKREAGSADGLSFVKSSFIGVGVSLAFGLAFLLASTFIAYLREDPDSMVGMLGLVIVYAVSLIAGFISVRVNKGGIFMCGVLCGVLILVLFWGISFLFDSSYDSSYSFIVKIIMRCAIPFMSVMGAYAGAQRKSSHRRKRKKR